MDSLQAKYKQHIDVMLSNARHILQRENKSTLAIHSGIEHYFFADDHGFPFKLNPHFNAWLPLNMPQCWLLINQVDPPKLILYQVVDFWHKPVDLDGFFFLDYFDVSYVHQVSDIKNYLEPEVTQWVYLGEDEALASSLGFTAINPHAVVHFLNYHRGYKTDYEIACLREASQVAVQGHLAIEDAVKNSPEFLSEFELNAIYLQATQQEESQLPYRAIIAQNDHAAVLHYQNRMRQRPQKAYSLLIDAGVDCYGYASDISRTYAYENNMFAEMIESMDQYQKQIITEIKQGSSYADLHQRSCVFIAQVLKDFKLALGSVEQLIEQGIVGAFFPHGLGHLLGLQVHDVGGSLKTPYLDVLQHKDSKKLRNQRLIEPRQVMTIEPGLYFIQQLLQPLRRDTSITCLDWSVIETLIPFGGIRIEDNILIGEHQIENLTRECGLHD
tara:strand:- start:8209 stop:9534 length:1326 start_codon:yes stop_codon:yes gene_type:complete